MRASGCLAVLLPLAALQATLPGRFAPAAAAGDVVLVAVVLAAWRRGPGAGLAWALAGGLLLDLMSFGALGVHALALLAAAQTAVVVGGRLDPGRWPGAAGGAALAALAYGGVLLAAAPLLGEGRPGTSETLLLLGPGPAADAALAAVVMAILVRVRGARVEL